MEKQIGKRRRSPAPEREKAPRAEDVKIDGKIKNERKSFPEKENSEDREMFVKTMVWKFRRKQGGVLRIRFFASLSRLVVFVDGGKDDSLIIIPEFIAENIKSPQMFRVLFDSYF